MNRLGITVGEARLLASRDVVRPWRLSSALAPPAGAGSCSPCMNSAWSRWLLFLALLPCWLSLSVRAATVTGAVVDAADGQPVAARLYLQGADGRWHHPGSADAEGSAVRYGRTNWINPRSVEVHTAISAHPFQVELPPGPYRLVIERGHEYFPATNEFVVAEAPVRVEVALRRWVNLAARGWYSGETHVHRTPEELRTVLLAEDLNVAFPLSFWVTRGGAAPTAGDKNMAGDFPAELVEVDATHVLWPRNTEYEIFTLGGRSHTLGALFLLNHRRVFTRGVPPWGPVAAEAQAEGALLDMDKLDWPFSLLLPPVTGAQLYELANNHQWRTAFAFTNYASFAPPYLHPPYGSRTGTERDWTLYSFGMYYTLLNAGFRPVPTAGTASGVHPNPVGFSRVYVHLPEGFSYDAWLNGLAAGRSFVTTGPMLFATVDGRDPGAVPGPAGGAGLLRVAGSVRSADRIAFLEVVHNGIVVRTVMGQNRATPEGARESTFDTEVACEGSGWLAVRCWEERPDGRFRWAHSAPWHWDVPGRPLRPRAEERDFLIERMRVERERSRAVLSPEALAECDQALAAYVALTPADDSEAVARQARPPAAEADLRAWLENMVVYHGFNEAEVRAATGLTVAEVRAAQERWGIRPQAAPPRLPDAPLRVLPYPGGRHPRTGFLDGALNPQRDTKISVFTPWDPRSYVVVDVPEAIWSNLGLTYLAHEHIETVWTRQGITLAPQEWQRRADGVLEFERTLPNGIAFGTRVIPGREAVRMEGWLRNGTPQPLAGLRWQNCVMLKGAEGFHEQTGHNKVLRAPYAACRSANGRRWIITAWDPLDGVWQNPPVPCLHSNPKFPDCAPGETVWARGWLSFFEGEDLAGELERIERIGWRAAKPVDEGKASP